MTGMRTPPDPLFIKEGEEAQPKGAFNEVQEKNLLPGGTGGVPYLF